MIFWFGPVSLVVGIFATSLFYGPKNILPHISDLGQKTKKESEQLVKIITQYYTIYKERGTFMM